MINAASGGGGVGEIEEKKGLVGDAPLSRD